MLRIFARLASTATNATANRGATILASTSTSTSKSKSTSTSSSASSSRPQLSTILPSKRTINRILFDCDSNITYSKMMPLLTHIYDNLATPSKIEIPRNIKSFDLMVFRKMLTTIRSQTQSVNKNLVALENELVEQSAEMGNLDAIAILAFETIRNHLKRNTIVTKQDKEDFQSANKLVQELTEMKHPLVFKLAGDVALERNYWDRAHDYYLQFLEVEDDTIPAGHVNYQLGYYYYANPQDQVRDHEKAKQYFERCLKLTELDNYATKAHFYLGQIYLNNSIENGDKSNKTYNEYRKSNVVEVDDNVARAKYHWEIAASKALAESFSSLGFLELNKLNNPQIAIEWFKIGVEANKSDIVCLIGQFDCFYKLGQWNDCKKVWQNMHDLKQKMNDIKRGISPRNSIGTNNVNNKGKKVRSIPENMKETFNTNDELLSAFFKGRNEEFQRLESLGYGIVNN